MTFLNENLVENVYMTNSMVLFLMDKLIKYADYIDPYIDSNKLLRVRTFILMKL